MAAQRTSRRARPSCGELLDHHGAPLLRPRRPRDRRRRLRRAARRAAPDRGRAPRARHAGLADPAGRRRAGQRAARRSRHLQPMLSLANARSEEELRAWVARMRNHLAREGIEDPRLRVRLRAEDRRPGDLAAVPRRRASSAARRAATARSARTSPTTCARSPRSRQRLRGGPAAARGPRRGLHERSPTSRRSTSAAPRQGESTFMNPRNSAAGTIRQLDPQPDRRAAAVDVGLRRSASPTGVAFARHSRGAGLAAGARLPGQRRHRARSTTRTRSSRQCLRLAGPPRRAGLRDRRRRRQGRRRRAAAPARRGGPRPALGDRLEVPADDDGHDCCATSCGTSASSATCTRSPSLEPVHVGGVTVKLATLHNEEDLARKDVRAGRRGHRPARGRRHPAGRLAGAARRRAHRRAPRPASARAVPGLRHADRQARGRGLHEVPEPRLPGAPVAAAQALRLARGDGHRRARREAGRGAAGAGLVADAPPTSTGLTAEQLAELEGYGEVSARNLVAAIERSKDRPFGRVLFAIGLEEVGFVTGRNLAQQLPLDRRAAGRDARARSRRRPGIGPMMAETIVRAARRRRTMRELIEDLRAQRPALRGGGPAARRGRR